MAKPRKPRVPGDSVGEGAVKGPRRLLIALALIVAVAVAVALVLAASSAG